MNYKESVVSLLYENLLCVYCDNRLLGPENSLSQGNIVCPSCGQRFPIVDNIPILINENKSIFTFDSFISKENLFFDISTRGKFIGKINKLIPSLGKNWVAKKNFKLLSELLINENSKPKVLVLGGSIEGYGMKEFLSNAKLEIIESDVSFGPRTQIVFDAHNIPYLDETFDLVIAQAVLEHVLDPYRCVAEIYRVLKSDGLVYAETPFMQQVHGGPYDFARFSRTGHRMLFRQFKEVNSGMIAGPGTSLLWNWEYLLLSLFGYSSTLRLIIKAFARYSAFWVPYLDFLCKNNPRSVDSASGLFFIGKKGREVLSDRELIHYYR